MAMIISSSIRTSAAEKRRDHYLNQAHLFLEYASRCFQAQNYEEALEYAYRAALRTAGAVAAVSPVLARRKRLPSSAWDRLALTGAEGKAWARQLRSYSALRGHVASGIIRECPPSRVWALMSDAQRFLDDVEGLSDSFAVA